MFSRVFGLLTLLLAHQSSNQYQFKFSCTLEDWIMVLCPENYWLSLFNFVTVRSIYFGFAFAYMITFLVADNIEIVVTRGPLNSSIWKMYLLASPKYAWIRLLSQGPSHLFDSNQTIQKMSPPAMWAWQWWISYKYITDLTHHRLWTMPTVLLVRGDNSRKTRSHTSWSAWDAHMQMHWVFDF